MMENGVREVKKKQIAAFAALCGPLRPGQKPNGLGPLAGRFGST